MGLYSLPQAAIWLGSNQKLRYQPRFKVLTSALSKVSLKPGDKSDDDSDEKVANPCESCQPHGFVEDPLQDRHSS